MKRAALAALLLLAFSGSLFAQGAMQRYLVGTRHGSLQGIREIVGVEIPARQYREVVPFESVNAFAVDLTSDEVATLRRSPNVRYVEPDIEVHALTDTVTPGSETVPYGVTMVDAPGVWSVTKGVSVDGGPTVHIAIIDTGMTYDNPELAGAYRGGWNFVAGTADPRDDNGHGTHVAGIVAAAQNGFGVVGVAPQADVWSLKVLDSCGSGSLSTIVRAIDWVIAKKAAIGGDWIMSLSLGHDVTADSPEPQTEIAAFQRAADAGILTFAAAGNSYDPAANPPSQVLSYPAALPTVISVGAVDSTETVASFSQRGPDLKLVAPGVSVLSTFVSEEASTDDGRTIAATLPSATSFCPSAPPAGPTAFVSCGIGNPGDFPPSVAGKIALIQRGTLLFTDKAKNAKLAGAIAAVIYNNSPTPVLMDFSSLTNGSTVVPSVMISQDDGASLLGTPNAKLSFSFGLQSYQLDNGTSMATPHASAAAALAWAVAPNATADQIRTALLNNAKDLGAPGFDTTYGFGLVDALAAAKSLAPQKFGITPPPPPPPTGRFIHHRG